MGRCGWQSVGAAANSMCSCVLGGVPGCCFVLSCFEGSGWLMSATGVPWDMRDPVLLQFCPLNPHLRTGVGLGWVGLGWVKASSGPPGPRTSPFPARRNWSGWFTVVRTDDRPHTPRWHTRERDATVPVCMGRVCCMCVRGTRRRGSEACRVTRQRCAWPGPGPVSHAGGGSLGWARSTALGPGGGEARSYLCLPYTGTTRGRHGVSAACYCVEAAGVRARGGEGWGVVVPCVEPCGAGIASRVQRRARDSAVCALCGGVGAVAVCPSPMRTSEPLRVPGLGPCTGTHRSFQSDDGARGGGGAAGPRPWVGGRGASHQSAVGGGVR